MSQRVRKYLPTLRRIHRLSEKNRRACVEKCDRGFLDCLSECAKNVIKGNVPMNDRQLKSLRREKKNLRQLSLKKTSLKKKRKILQKGGFLGALIPPILSVLGGLIAGNANG
jgi:hypothetical protein